MELWTAEVAGKPVGVFQAAQEKDAESYVRSADFAAELKELEADGAPVWNGTDKVGFRKASAEEKAEWQESYAAAVEEEEIEEGETDWLVWLIEDEDDENEEEDEDEDDDEEEDDKKK